MQLRSPSSWYQRARLLADTKTLPKLLAGQRLRENTFILATTVLPGVGQPGYYPLSLGGFEYSWQRFWPASTVKIVAAVAALWTLSKHNLDARAWLRFEDADGHFSGPVERLLKRALIKSTNVDYNRLMQIAGFRAVNEDYLVARWGLPQIVLQRRYTHPTPEASLRISPEMTYQQGQLRGVIAQRQSDRRYTRCPEEANCTTLFELQEVIRRLLLHAEIPPASRFPLKQRSVTLLKKLLKAAPNKLGGVPASVFSHPVDVYNKAGRVPGDDHLENALLVCPKTGERVFFTATVPYASPREPDEVSLRLLRQLAQAVLPQLRQPRSGPWLQEDAGPDVNIRARSRPTRLSATRIPVTLSVHPVRPVVTVRLWVDRRELTRSTKPTPVKLETQLNHGAPHSLVVIGYDEDDHPISYKMYLMTLVPIRRT